jgi:hypothetical protein
MVSYQYVYFYLKDRSKLKFSKNKFCHLIFIKVSFPSRSFFLLFFLIFFFPFITLFLCLRWKLRGRNTFRKYALKQVIFWILFKKLTGMTVFCVFIPFNFLFTIFYFHATIVIYFVFIPPPPPSTEKSRPHPLPQSLSYCPLTPNCET